MIKILELNYINFLSAGNNGIHVDLTSRSILVTGVNGTGKSTLASALSFGLFGEVEKECNKSELINNVNGKDCLVTVKFSKDSDLYEVNRGIKPNVFDIIKNGVLVDKPSNVKEYQVILNDILGIDYDMWVKLIHISKTNFVPFFKMSAKDRREFIENLLDIQIFSEIQSKIKDEVKVLKEKNNLNNLSISNAEEYIKKTKEFHDREFNSIASRKEDIRKKVEFLHSTERKRAVDKKDDELRGIEAERSKFIETFNWEDNSKSITEVEDAISKIVVEDVTGKLKELQSLQDKIKKDKDELSSVVAEMNLLMKQGKEAKAELDKFMANPNCPTCGKAVDEHQLMVLKLEAKVEALREKYKSYGSIKVSISTSLEINQALEQDLLSSIENSKNCSSKREQLISKLENLRNVDVKKVKQELYDKTIANYQERYNKILDTDYEEMVNKEIRILEDQLTSLNNHSLSEVRETIISKEKELEELRHKYSQYEAEGRHLDVLTKLFKDDGIKSIVIRKYVPFINKKMNEYLDKLGLFLHFRMDENFNETLKRNYVHECSYFLLSEGQRQRVDLSLIFTFMDIAEVRNISRFSLFILDDMVGALDDSGVKDLLSLIEDNNKHVTPVMITHKKDDFCHIFDKIVEFSLHDGFSALIS